MTISFYLIQVVNEFDEFFTTNMPELSLFGLSSYNNCNLFGWGEQSENSTLRQTAVQVHSPQFCDPKFPEVFCSLVDTSSDEICSASLGSRLVCSNDSSKFAGILLNNETCSTTESGNTVLRYHSISHYNKWIDEVLKSDDKNRDISTSYIVNIIKYTSPDVNTAITSCVGTIITLRHVLTTASCVEGKKYDLAVESYFENKGLTLGKLSHIFSRHFMQVEIFYRSSN
jgi:hypothetical protein